jgi:hypothetical protein
MNTTETPALPGKLRSFLIVSLYLVAAPVLIFLIMVGGPRGGWA